MIIKKTKEFNTISQRILYGFNLIYSDFDPIISDIATKEEQKELHELMGCIIDKLYDNPNLLNLEENLDEAYSWGLCNNQKPELNIIYLSIYKKLNEFYKFLYISTLHGNIDKHNLLITENILKENKTGYKPIFNKLLKEVNIIITKENNNIILNAKESILKALKLLSIRVPITNISYHPYDLVDFMRCSFNNTSDYILTRFDNINNLNGLLFDLKNECIKKGYKQQFDLRFTATDLEINITFTNKVGGFLIGYNSRKYGQFYFGTLNGVGEKAMLEDFENLDDDMKKHFISICRKCSGCLTCTKNGKNKIFTINVSYNDNNYNLCPAFPYHQWETIDNNLIHILFKYHELQEKYSKN